MTVNQSALNTSDIGEHFTYLQHDEKMRKKVFRAVEKNFTLKFSQNQEISLGFQSIIWSMFFLKPTKIAFSCRIIISTCRVML